MSMEHAGFEVSDAVYLSFQFLWKMTARNWAIGWWRVSHIKAEVLPDILVADSYFMAHDLPSQGQ